MESALDIGNENLNKKNISFRRLRGGSKSTSKQMFHTSISEGADSAFSTKRQIKATNAGK
jgi:hypothetical protein